MPITTGGFEDLVQLSQDTLYYVGANFQIGNTSVGSSATVGFNNTAGDLQLVGVATGNATAWLPAGGGTLATQATLSNSNNLSFGLNAGTITASYAFNVSAGTTSNNLNALTFSNGSGVSWGLNGSVVTASVNAGGGGVAIADDNGHTVSSGTVQFSNSNNLSFGLNGSTMTGSYALNVSGTGANTYDVTSLDFINGQVAGGSVTVFVNASAGTTSNNVSALTFSNSNNNTWGLNGSTLTISAPVNFSAGTTSNNLTQLSFANGGGVTWGLNGGTVTASAVVGSVASVNFSAGTTSVNASAITFGNSYNVSFGISNGIGGATMTASANMTGDWYDNIVRAQPGGSASGEMGSMSNFTGSASSLFVAPLHGYGQLFPYDMTANTVFFPDVSLSGSTATMSVAFTSKWFLGIYTLNGSSLSLLNSVSISFGFAAAATNNSTGFAGGYRYATIHSSLWSSSPVFNFGSRYWLAWFWSSAGANNQTGAMAGAFMFSTGQRSGLLGASNLTATSNGAAPFFGIYTAQTAALPSSIGSNQLQKTASIAGFNPHLILAQNASLTVF